MRELTNKEKKLIDELIKNANPNNGVKIGDILLKLYDIVCIEEITDTNNSEFYKGGIKCEYKCNYQTACYNEINMNIYEAVSLILTLIDLRFIIIRNYYNHSIIGEKSEMVNFIDSKTGEGMTITTNIYDPFNTNLWRLMNSNYVITNGLIDYKQNKYRTIEQRRFDKSMGWTRVSVFIAFIIGLVSIIISICALLNS